ncbi:carbonic anhydrase-related protein 10-like [Littorina saxatilis]|uniref:carbonic anhydrase-related protein 10-like n=1 Tax=Littorina saxatilis TaxID=31220 RepID=UPI0038B5F32E
MANMSLIGSLHILRPGRLKAKERKRTLVDKRSDGSLWESWWDYQGISGPQFWGFTNKAWVVCSKGRNQSPINVDPSNLLFDPTLSPLLLFGDLMTGTLRNNGHDITFSVQHNGNPRYDGVNITGGPLSYTYRVDQIKFHFSLVDFEGSEHSIGKKSFPVEIQIFAYNTDLYANYSEAEASPKGLAAIAVFAQVSDRTHKEFSVFQRAINTTQYKGDWTYVERLRLRQLLPPTEQYVTYEGSITTPGCHETVTWLVYNRPIYISKKQLSILRSLRQGTRYNPVMLMAPNIRPVQSLNQRTPRTNINFRERTCTMSQNMYYQVNDQVSARDIR